jgi:hypothetical protein
MASLMTSAVPEQASHRGDQEYTTVHNEARHTEKFALAARSLPAMSGSPDDGEFCCGILGPLTALAERGRGFNHGHEITAAHGEEGEHPWRTF